MPLGAASDLAFMLRDAGEKVSLNGTDSYGILEVIDSLEQTGDGGVMQIKVHTVLVQTSVFSDAAGALVFRHDGRITVNDNPYRIDRAAPEDDGEVTRVYLARAS